MRQVILHRVFKLLVSKLHINVLLVSHSSVSKLHINAHLVSRSSVSILHIINAHLVSHSSVSKPHIINVHPESHSSVSKPHIINVHLYTNWIFYHSFYNVYNLVEEHFQTCTLNITFTFMAIYYSSQLRICELHPDVL